MTSLQEVENCGKCIRKFVDDEERYVLMAKQAILCKECAERRDDISFPICGGRDGWDYLFGGGEGINRPWRE